MGPPTLNDARTYTRAVAFGQLVPGGMLVGAIPVVVAGEVSATAFVTVMVVALVTSIIANVVTVSVARREDRRLVASVDEGTRELTSGAVPLARPVPAVVVRRRRDVVVMTALLPEAGARRVALHPPRVLADELRRGSHHLVHLHPRRPDVALLDAGADAHLRHLAGQDPRWTAWAVPTDGSVIGGYAAAAAFGAAGFLVGVGLGASVALVVSAL
jgi:tetrahydromethanopterin S-methyltransferase subunit B